MLSLSARTSPRRPRRATPQVDALEDIISLTNFGLCQPCQPPNCCPTFRVDVDQQVCNNIWACNSNVSNATVQVGASINTDVTVLSVAGNIEVDVH